MTAKILTCISAALLIVLLSTAGPARAEGQCAKLMNSICLGCHNQDRFCERLGATENQWRSLLKWMIANGAELEDDEVNLLVGCLSEPADEAKKTCGR